MWRLFGNKNNAAAASAAPDQQPAADASRDATPGTDTFRAWGNSHASGTSSSRQVGTSFLSTRDKSLLDKKVSTAARNLGDGVQRIVLAAKTKQQPVSDDGQPTVSSSWKSDLLELLGAIETDSSESTAAASADTMTTTADASSSNTSTSDIDTLLQHTSYEHFVARCVENELPPNLVHCMRLLRVVELQHAAEHDAAVNGDIGDSTPLTPIAETATTKVSKLLCSICINPIVGEQLRPHLFGLLALSGASYPVSGLHVAKAASNIIMAVADECLSRQLVWFMHDRKMILHMVDDVKELCGILPMEIGPATTSAASNTQPASKGLTGPDAERHGLWHVALETIVKLLVASCRFLTVDLVKDFEQAGGYDVLTYAVKHGTQPHGEKVVELLPALACCPSELTTTADMAEKVASNIRVFEILEELLVGSNPLLREYRRRRGDLPFIIADIGSLSDLASLSIEIAITSRLTATEQKDDEADAYSFDATSALLNTILQIFSDHTLNYEILEGKHHVLSYCILALPCFTDDATKLSVLKTLEFVLTAIEIKNETAPVTAYVEVFFALCQAIGRQGAASSISPEDWPGARAVLMQDLNLMGSTLEKLLQFDQRVAPLMAEGVLVGNLPLFLDQMEEHTKVNGSCRLPPAETDLDLMYGVVCNVVKLLVAQQAAKLADEGESNSDSRYVVTIHRLLTYAICELGNEAARSAETVFEVFMSSFASLAAQDREMRFAFAILRGLGDLFVSNTEDPGRDTIVERQTGILSLLRSVLEATATARRAFRRCDGFEAIISTVLSMENAATVSDHYREEVLVCLRVIFGILDAALGFRTRHSSTSMHDSPVILPRGISVDPSSSEVSIGSPGALNRSFMRKWSFYSDFAAAVFGTGIMETITSADILELCMRHIDPDLKIENSGPIESIRNPDAVRLLLRVSQFLTELPSATPTAVQLLEPLLHLCGDEAAGSCTRSMASCGLVTSLTCHDEFASLLFGDRELQPYFRSLLRQVASCRMSYKDFVSFMRSVLGPLLLTEGVNDRIILPVISSSVGKKVVATEGRGTLSLSIDDHKEGELCERLRIALEIAEAAQDCPLLRVGGDSVNSIGIVLHDVDVSDRLRRVAQEGRLSFVEVTALKATAQQQPTTSADESGDKIWSPLLGSGFTFSVWLRIGASSEIDDTGNLYIFDVCAPTSALTGNDEPPYLSIWYDLSNKRFTVLSSASYRGEPTCFPVSPLATDVWHHILLTYSPSKRTMMSRKSSFGLFVNGRALEAEVRVESVSLPPDSHVVIGAPNPTLAASGILRGRISTWDLGPCILLSTVLLDLDAAAIHASGPNFSGLLWGDRPQRMSLAATGTLAFSLLAESGEPGSIASALKRRNIQKLEGAGYSTVAHQESDRDDLSAMGLLCLIPPDCVLFAFQASTSTCKLRTDLIPIKRTLQFERLVNLARLNFTNENVSTDAVIYGKGNVSSSIAFSDNLLQAGGPPVLIPLVNAASSPRSLAYALRLIRQGTAKNPPNLECMQKGGGYRILAVLIKEKGFADTRCLDECLAFGVTGFQPALDDTKASSFPITVQFDDEAENAWVLTDVDAMKHLLLNHQVWDMQKCGPDIPLRLLSALNVLVSQRALHKSFNARRLHMVGIIRWALHLMIEGAELYSASELALQRCTNAGDAEGIKHVKQGWYSESPLVSDVTVGGDPGNNFLLDCKKLLRRVLTFMLTPGDLEALADGIVFTLAISGSSSKLLDNETKQIAFESGRSRTEERMLPGPTARLYLVRLLEELIVDGVNEIVANTAPALKQKESGEKIATQSTVRYHSGGVASPNQPYLSTFITRVKAPPSQLHPKHQQAQAFLSAFSGFLTPVWFATVLEGCHEEATASATLRLMILMLQGSSAFESIFWAAGGFSPFVLSVPKFSTCPGITLTLLSELLDVPILHLPFFARLDAEQLCEVFDSESSEYRTALVSADPSSEIFGLLAECMGRNIKYMSINVDAGAPARETNSAIIHLIAHRHEVSPNFQKFCTTRNFLEPLSQALCLVYNERMSTRPRRRVLLSATPKDLAPTERFVRAASEVDDGSLGMVRLLRMVILDAMVSAPAAALVLNTMFQSFPIHASAQQIEALHLILLQQCRSVIEEVMEYGDAIFMANCVGLCSVLLNQQTSAFFTAEASLEAVKLSITILDTLIENDAQASASLDNAEHTLLTIDAAHIAGLMCVAALKTSLPMSYHDSGDEDFQAVILALVDANVDGLLLVQPRERKTTRRIPSAPISVTRPPPQSRLFPIWQSASFARCTSTQKIAYPDSSDNVDAPLLVVAPLTMMLQRSLDNSREDIRGPAVSVLVALLQHRLSVMSELLVAEIKTGNQIETIDAVNRGGFRALLTAHEAALVSNKAAPTASSVKKKYASFFDWFERNQSQVDLVFKAIDEKVAGIFPDFSSISTPHDEAVENKQKLMLMKLTTHTADNSILGGIERGELARRSAERTTDSHARWKRQGFDDLAYGATKWKALLRQLKGSGSIWEGGPLLKNPTAGDCHGWLVSLKARKGRLLSQPYAAAEFELVKRWKLDLSEGHEQQRRRLLPNYEFHGIYNLDGIEQINHNAQESNAEAMVPSFLVGPETEATTELLKDLKIKRAHSIDEEDIEEDDGVNEIIATEYNKDIFMESKVDVAEKPGGPINGDVADSMDKTIDDSEETSSYGLITGLLQPGDWPEKSFNVRRCTGLEVTKSLLLWCQDAVYIIDGFEQVGGAGMDGKITRVEREQSSFNISLRPKDFKVSEEKSLEEITVLNDERSHSKMLKQSNRTKNSAAPSTNDVLYQHRSQRISFSELYSVYRRRYQLQHTALEFHDVHRNSTLVAFVTNDEREEVLTKVLQAKLPKSIFSSSYGNFISYTKFMSNLKAKVISQWVNRKMTNFDFLMHLNSFAGRTFNDLTQYPVFPWVIADYDSEELDMDDPKTYRDLSKPMGGIGEQRAQQFRERYEALASTCFTDEDPPPFHYGTHYSCAAYVLYYLMRLEPFSRLALALQGGRFDVADRLFHDIGRSWKSASSENLQDVRELIPEFFYLPDFMLNTNHFDFGETQRGKTVHDVTLPKWAKGDPQRFVSINRQALESEYVSRNLHHWVDLIFGCKQRGTEAVEALNVFVHVTYEGQVDLDTMTDPVQKASTIAQIQNFGQTPSRLERRPFPQRIQGYSSRGKVMDMACLPFLSALTPAFCIVGAPNRVAVECVSTETCRLGLYGQAEIAAGDICLLGKSQAVGVGRMCALILPFKKYVRFGGLNNGVSIHSSTAATRSGESAKPISFHDGLHRCPITAAKASLNGDWLITGALDSTLKIWRYEDNRLTLRSTLCGHEGFHITCIDISTEFGVIASGCSSGTILLWDLRTYTFVRVLTRREQAGPAVSISINNSNGNVVVLVGSQLTAFDINGNVIARLASDVPSMPTYAVATDCPEWMENGVSIVTGHKNGQIHFWGIDYASKLFILSATLESNPHRSEITALRVSSSGERQDMLLSGDMSGKIGLHKTKQLENLNPNDPPQRESKADVQRL